MSDMTDDDHDTRADYLCRECECAMRDECDAALRELDAVRAELARERRRVRQLRRAVLFFSGGCALHHWPATIRRTTAERLLARARDRSHDDE